MWCLPQVNNIQLHLAWKLKVISPQQNTFHKPWYQASVLQNYQLTTHYVS